MTDLESTMATLLGRRVSLEDVPGLSPGSRVISVARLRSRKNAVHRIVTTDGELVLKTYDSDRWTWERMVLLACSSRGVRVPRVLTAGRGFILMEFLPGSDMCDLINDTLDPRYPEMIADWLSQLHLAFSLGEVTLVRSDAKLQNFILTGSGVAGVDLELAHLGDGLEDLGEVCAHILNTDPMFTREKHMLCDALLIRYASLTGRSLAGITGWVISALEEAARFRPAQAGALLEQVEALRRGRWPFTDHDQNR